MRDVSDVDGPAAGRIRDVIETLARVSPTSYARGVRVRRIVREVCLASGTRSVDDVELAALLSPLGALAQAPNGDAGRRQELASRLPEFAAAVLLPIPGTDQVREAILAQRARYDGDSPADPRAGKAIPLGGRVLRLAADYDDLVSGGCAPCDALRAIRRRRGSYDPDLVKALCRVVRVQRAMALSVANESCS